LEAGVGISLLSVETAPILLTFPHNTSRANQQARDNARAGGTDEVNWMTHCGQRRYRKFEVQFQNTSEGDNSVASYKRWPNNGP